MNDKEKLKLVDDLIFSGMLDPLVRAELVNSYDTSMEIDGADGWTYRDGLKRVIEHFSSATEYREFKEARGL
jgi:hypothetical protein